MRSRIRMSISIGIVMYSMVRYALVYYRLIPFLFISTAKYQYSMVFVLAYCATLEYRIRWYPVVKNSDVPVYDGKI